MCWGILWTWGGQALVQHKAVRSQIMHTFSASIGGRDGEQDHLADNRYAMKKSLFCSNRTAKSGELHFLTLEVDQGELTPDCLHRRVSDTGALLWKRTLPVDFVWKNHGTNFTTFGNALKDLPRKWIEGPFFSLEFTDPSNQYVHGLWYIHKLVLTLLLLLPIFKQLTHCVSVTDRDVAFLEPMGFVSGDGDSRLTPVKRSSTSPSRNISGDDFWVLKIRGYIKCEEFPVFKDTSGSSVIENCHPKHTAGKMYTVGNLYVIAAVAVVGGGLFGFDISSMSAIISTQPYLCYFNQGPLYLETDGKCSGPRPDVQGMSCVKNEYF